MHSSVRRAKPTMWGLLALWGGSSVGSESHGLKTPPSHPFAVSNVLCARVFGVPDLPCGVGVMGWQLSWERQPHSLHQQSTRSQITGTPPQNTTAAQIRDYDAGCLSTFLRRHSRAHNFQRCQHDPLSKATEFDHTSYFLPNLYFYFSSKFS